MNLETRVHLVKDTIQVTDIFRDEVPRFYLHEFQGDRPRITSHVIARTAGMSQTLYCSREYVIEPQTPRHSIFSKVSAYLERTPWKRFLRGPAVEVSKIFSARANRILAPSCWKPRRATYVADAAKPRECFVEIRPWLTESPRTKSVAGH